MATATGILFSWVPRFAGFPLTQFIYIYLHTCFLLKTNSNTPSITATMTAVEDFNGQCFSTWNSTVRNLLEHAKNYNNVGSLLSQTTRRIVSTPPPPSSMDGGNKAKQSEESLRKIMYLSCWGPN
ncbi:hypothetical protein ZOSMA_118G00540 [Zostera marina]|uniref:Uncharacterized protein n=1 Tax=Zostera marina TaxID=29655 RepID=A0A0K9Q1X9_ZOSMR|nr:hypothetical protein ZOSMA_118G00540 [Zostera marina]